MFAVALLLGVGCAVPKAIQWQSSNPQRGYRFTLTDWTRTSVAYHEFQTQLFVQGTLLSPAFTQIYSREFARRAGLTKTQAAAHREKALKDLEGSIDLFMAVATRDAHWNDLDEKAPTLTIRMYIDDNSEALLPTKLLRLNDNEMADKRPFFPFADQLKTGYMLKFPYKGPKPKKVRVTVSGAPGLSELNWVLTP